MYTIKQKNSEPDPKKRQPEKGALNSKIYRCQLRTLQ